MRPLRRYPISALLLAFSTAVAVAGGSSAPFGYTPDPTLRSASPAELQTRIRRACGSTQARVQGVSETQVGRGCACYAQRVMRSLDAAEVEAYRSTGVFNDTARGKALAAIDECRLKRPV